MVTVEVLDKWLDDTIDAIKKKYNAMGLRASGNFERSLRKEITQRIDGYTGKIFGSHYVYYLVNGRGKTKSLTAGNPTLRQIIRKWIDVKGITPYNNISKDSLAYLITRKIHTKGIPVPNQYNNGSLLDVINTKELARELTLSEIVAVKSEVLKLLKIIQ